MASPMVVKRTLMAVANMHNKHPNWVDDSLRMWVLQLNDVPDKDVIQGCKDLLRKSKAGRIPTVANLLEMIDASPTKTPPHETVGCRACDGTGQRHMVRWYRHNGKQQVVEYAAACDCEKGRMLAVGSLKPWQMVLNAWKANPYTDKAYHGTEAEPVVPLRHRVHPDVWERLTKGNTQSVGNWRKAVARDE